MASCQHHDRAADAAGWSRRLGAAAALTGAVALESLNSGSQTAWSGADCQTRRSDSRTGRRSDLCRSNASSHQRRNTPRPALPPREEQQPAGPVVEPEPLAQAPQGKPTPPTSPSTQPTTRGASAPAPRRRAAARTTEDATAPPAAPVRFVGDLSITSTPQGARVVVNGRAVGVTPLTLREQRAGSVAVQIASEGFERWSASVQIPAGQVTNIVATLRASRP